MKERFVVPAFQEDKVQLQVTILNENNDGFLHMIAGLKNGRLLNFFDAVIVNWRSQHHQKRKLIVWRVSLDFSKELEITFWTVWTLDE